MYLLGVALGPFLFGLLFIIDYKQIIGYNLSIELDKCYKGTKDDSALISALKK